jgi:hypothetical protein
MRAILIDAVAKTVTKIESTGALQDLYQILGCDCVDARTIAGMLYEPAWHSVFVDDEGLLREPPETHYFEIAHEHGTTGPIGGRGLVIGGDKEGKNIAATMTLDEVRAMVTFTERRFRGLREIPARMGASPRVWRSGQVGVEAELPIVDGSNEE